MWMWIWKYLEDANVRAGLFIRVEKGGGRQWAMGTLALFVSFLG